MNETFAATIISLLALLAVILLWQSVVLVRIARSLDQPPTKTKHPEAIEASASPQQPTPQNSTPQTDFDRFLLEDPGRLDLGKKEQAAAYRTWRKQNGLTWNA